MPKAAFFAKRAAHSLEQGSSDWERANDIMAVAGPNDRH
jgi:hypothetical protein